MELFNSLFAINQEIQARENDGRIVVPLPVPLPAPHVPVPPVPYPEHAFAIIRGRRRFSRSRSRDKQSSSNSRKRRRRSSSTISSGRQTSRGRKLDMYRDENPKNRKKPLSQRTRKK